MDMTLCQFLMWSRRMAAVISSVYEAFRKANVPQDLAMEAAEDITTLMYGASACRTGGDAMGKEPTLARNNKIDTDIQILKFMAVVNFGLLLLIFILMPAA